MNHVTKTALTFLVVLWAGAAPGADIGLSGKNDAKGLSGVLGRWEMKTELGDNAIEATMTLSVKDGKLAGTWTSQGNDMEMLDLTLSGDKLTFKRTIPGGQDLKFQGTIKGNRISGHYTGPFGKLRSTGSRKVANGDKAKPKAKRSTKKPKTNYRGLLGAGSKKIKVEGGKTYVWAGGDASGSGAKWYDFTGAPMPPEKLQFGIGKDRIPSIDDPFFVAPDDPRLMDLPKSPYRRDERPKNNDEIMVIGYIKGGDARAYPVGLLDHHELVNDRIGGKPVTVGW